MKQMSLEHYRESQRLAHMLPEHVASIRDSFYSLIGDIWISAIVAGAMKSSHGDIGHCPLLAMWDSSVPLPNERTALAWLLTCENDPLATRPRIVLPESIDPYLYMAQQDSFEGQLMVPNGLPSIHTLKTRCSQEFMARFRSANRRGPAPVYTIFRGKIQPAGMNERLPRETDELRMGLSEIEAVAIRRHALMSQVLTAPTSPTSQAAYWTRGFHIRGWSQSGLAVRLAPAKRSQITSAFDKVRVPAPPQIVNGEPVPTLIAHVPTVTPPIWLGFTTGTVKGKEDSTAWLNEYMKFRDAAKDQFERGFSTGVMSPEWKISLSEAGRIEEEKAKPKAKGVKGNANFAAALAALANVES